LYRYNVINNPELSKPIYASLGKEVQKKAGPNQFVYTNLWVNPVSNYYAKRNLRLTFYGHEARAMSRVHNRKAVFFKVNSNNKLQIITYFPNGDSTVVLGKTLQN
jgi:hypothetical protein